MHYDCFISYSVSDLALAEELHRRLVGAGFNIWFDKVRLKPGFDWHREIEAACENSRVLLPLLTPRWRLSEWTKYETYGAESVIPLVAEGERSAVMTPPLLRYQALQLNPAEADDGKWEELFVALRDRLAQPALDPSEKTKRTAHLRFRPTPHFMGRVRELENLHEHLYIAPSAALTQGQARAITSLGGVGKTTLARMYAEKFWRCYSQVFWVDARLGYESEYARLCDLIDPDFKVANPDAKDVEKAHWTVAELENTQSRHPRLLIIDNVENETASRDWIPKTGHVHTLLTSRFSQWEAISPFPIDVLTPEAAIELLMRRSDRRDALDSAEKRACQELAESLGCLPLALEQAAAFIRKQGQAFAFLGYLELYRESERELLSQHAQGTTEYPTSVLLTWRTTVRHLSNDARNMLKVAAFLAPIEIPFQMLVDGFEGMSHTATIQLDFEPQPVTAALRARECRNSLAEYSMVSVTVDDGFTVHPVVQAVERHHLSTRHWKECLEWAIRFFRHHAPPNPTEFETWDAWRTLVVHAITLDEHSKLFGDYEFPTMIVSQITTFYCALGEDAQAVPYARRAVKENAQRLGPDDPSTIASTSLLAAALRSCGQIDEAEFLFRENLARAKRVLGLDSTKTLHVMTGLAGLLANKGEFREAESLSRGALELSMLRYGPDDSETVGIMNNLATILQQKGEPDEAIELSQRVAHHREQRLGSSHPGTLQARSNLARAMIDTRELPRPQSSVGRAKIQGETSRAA